jgi:hypothetical protein
MTHEDLQELGSAITAIQSVSERMDERGELTPQGRRSVNESLSRLRAFYFNHRLGAQPVGG